MRVVVLGANGQVGAPIMKRLLQDYPQAQVFGCVREDSMAAVKEDFLLSQHVLPFNPFTDDWAKLGKVDVLINCIGIIKETAALDFAQAHIGLAKLMLQHREMFGNPRLIQLSALGATVTSPSRFLSTKAQADALLLARQNVVVVRPSIVCTPNTMLSKKLQLLKKVCRTTLGLLPFPELVLQTKLQPVLVEDLADLISRLCLPSKHEGVVEVAGKDIVTIQQLLALVPTCKKVLPIPQSVANASLQLVTNLFPALLDKEQQVLLLQDNIASTTACERILKREMSGTLSFWKSELR